VGVPPERIEQEFGKEIRFLVEGVTKLGQFKYHGAERQS
jgi:(p)ppGpp synthase/HD superfamily hydrolase